MNSRLGKKRKEKKDGYWMNSRLGKKKKKKKRWVLMKIITKKKRWVLDEK